MENNCFVTKLKASVNNNNLHKLGVLTVKYNTSPSSGSLRIKYVGASTPAKAFDANGNLLGTSYDTGVTGEIRIDFANLQNISYVEVYDIYNIKTASLGAGNPEPISSCFSLTDLSVGWNQNINFHINDLPAGMQIINVGGTCIIGKTSDLSKFPDITRLDATYVSTFTGSVEEFGEILFRSYSQDKDVILGVAGGNIKFNGVAVRPVTTYTLSVTSNQVTVKVNDVVKATYNGTTWTYNS